MKQLLYVSTVALLLLTLALPTWAAGPTFTDNPFTPAVIPAAQGCGTFDVSVAPEAGKPNGGRIITFANKAIFHGPVFVTFTNLSNGTSINRNVSGPAKAIFTTNVAVNYGSTVFIGLTSPAPPNLQGLVLAHGRAVFQFDNSGNIVSVNFNGTTENLCALLE